MLKKRAQALVDGNHARLLQLLPNQQHIAEKILKDKTASVVEREKILKESVGRSSDDLQESLLTLVRNESEDTDLRILALSILQINRITDAKEMDKAMESLKERWQEQSDPKAQEANFFARSFVQECRTALTTQTQAAESFAAREKLFEAAIAIRELGESKPLGISGSLQNQALSSLLICLRTDKETESTLKYESRAIASRIIPLLAKDFGQLTDAQKIEFGQKSVAILNWPYKNDLTIPQAKLEVLKHLHFFTGSMTFDDKEKIGH